MTTPRTIDNYGSVFDDAYSVEDATTEQSAAYANRVNEDVAHMSRTTPKVILQFLTTTTAAVTPATVTAGRSHAGTSSGLWPTVSKTATGRYTVTWPASFVDELGVTETLSLTFARGDVIHNTTFARVQCTAAGANVVLVSVITNNAGTDTLSDLGGNVPIQVEAL